MTDKPDTNDRPAAHPLPAEPQPWHAADEKKPAGGGAPIGTHSLTGGGANVGMPTRPKADDAEPGLAPTTDRPAEPDALAEPRASVGEILGRKP